MTTVKGISDAPVYRTDRAPLRARALYDFRDYGFSIFGALAYTFDIVPVLLDDEAFFFFFPLEDVAAGRLDIALSAEAVPAFLETKVLYEDAFVCLVGSRCRTRTRRFTLKQYLDRSHAIVETWEHQQTPVDRRLAELGMKRHAGLYLPFFVPAVLAIARTDLVLTLPRRLAKTMVAVADVRVVEPPREIKGFSYFMAWHARLTSEPAHVWFREHLRKIARAI